MQLCWTRSNMHRGNCMIDQELVRIIRDQFTLEWRGIHGVPLLASLVAHPTSSSHHLNVVPAALSARHSYKCRAVPAPRYGI